MPNRILREGILTSERIERLDWAEEVFYRRVMSVVDDYGRYYARPALLRSACYPLHLDRVTEADIQTWLSACEQAGLIHVYEVDGKRYLELLDFRQQLRAKVCKYPDPVGACVAPATQMHCRSSASAEQAQANAHLVGVGVGDGDDSKVDQAKPDRLPPCPVQKIAETYNDALPELPRVRLTTGKRERLIRRRWQWVLTDKRDDGTLRATTADEGLQWFKNFFRRAQENDFIMGRTARGIGHESWRADFDYLLSDRGLTQVIEKTGAPT
jgi:hypothetical protein